VCLNSAGHHGQTGGVYNLPLWACTFDDFPFLMAMCIFAIYPQRVEDKAVLDEEVCHWDLRVCFIFCI
jgi:hypothetical protein